MRVPRFDRSEAAAMLRRSVATAPAQAAESLARFVRDSPDHRLQALMRTPARRVVLESIFWQMPKYLDRDRARGVRASVRWCITGRSDGGTDVYHLEIADGHASVARGTEAGEARVTITVDGAEFLRLASGTSDPMQAYFQRRLLLSGDLLVAAKVVSLFRTPSAPRRDRPDPR
jgi:predicted lipid carrier protein YhbT